MTVRISITFFIYLTLFEAIGQTYSSTISNQKIHNFLFQLNSSKTIRIHKISPNIFPWTPLLFFNDTSYKEPPFYFLNKTSKEYSILQSTFGQTDIKFLKQQSISLKDSIWDFKQLQGFIRADSTVKKQIVKKSLSGKQKIKDNYSYTFSIPLFSVDRKSVIIYQNFFCGVLCSTACIYLYKKDNLGVWRQVLSWSCWSSWKKEKQHPTYIGTNYTKYIRLLLNN